MCTLDILIFIVAVITLLTALLFGWQVYNVVVLDKRVKLQIKTTIKEYEELHGNALRSMIKMQLQIAESVIQIMVMGDDSQKQNGIYCAIALTDFLHENKQYINRDSIEGIMTAVTHCGLKTFSLEQLVDINEFVVEFDFSLEKKNTILRAIDSLIKEKSQES